MPKRFYRKSINYFLAYPFAIKQIDHSKTEAFVAACIAVVKMMFAINAINEMPMNLNPPSFNFAEACTGMLISNL